MKLISGIKTMINKILIGILMLFSLLVSEIHYVLIADETDTSMESLNEEREIIRELTREEIINTLKNNDESKIDIIKKSFEKSNEEAKKSLYAAVLLRLGVNDEIYWQYLTKVSIKAIESDTPSPYKYDEKGNLIRGKYSENFLKWLEENNIDRPTATTNYIFIYPAIVRYLGLSGDKRGFNIILKGLESKNDYIVLSSVYALGMLNDKRGIDYIIDTCRKYPQTARFMAKALAYIDDPKAQESIEEFILDEKSIESLKWFAKNKDYSLILMFY